VPYGGSIGLIDGPAVTPFARSAAGLLRVLGIRAVEIPFVAAELKASSGESVPLAARRGAFAIALRAAQQIVSSSPLLREVSKRCERGTVPLYLARRLWRPIDRIRVRALVADALEPADTKGATLVMAWPSELPRDLDVELPTRVALRFVGVRRAGWRAGRCAAVLWLLRERVRAGTRRLPRPGSADTGTLPALLLLQEDDVSLDHSYRAQPHWLRRDSEPPPFRTLVLRTAGPGDVLASRGELAHHRIQLLPAIPFSTARGMHRPPIACGLRRDTHRLCRLALIATDEAVAMAALQVLKLTSAAEALACLVVAEGVRAFLTCENYMLHADAMQLIAAPLKLRTMSYQYANLAFPSIVMATTARTMITFSPMFHSRYTWTGLKAPAFKDAGYLYDSSFRLVRPRALERRARLRAAGAAYVIGLFDESVQRHKLGLVDVRKYENHLTTILERVLSDDSLGLVFKTQFHHNLEGGSTRLRELLRSAAATGRVELPSRGRNRNTILPAEVALSSDIVIGYAIGGTASLESALTGCRSIMVNEHGLRTENDALYRNLDIVYPTIHAALDAIEAFRAGDPARRMLGDWRPVLHDFDCYRDGNADARMRAAIEHAVFGDDALLSRPC
jgi:hypothetical protein